MLAGRGWAVLFLVMGLARFGLGQVTGGSDLADYIAREDARLGAGRGRVVLAEAGRIGRPVTLGQGHDLEVREPVVWGATVRLAGGNTVRCVGAGAISAELPEYVFAGASGMLLLAENTRDIHVNGCRVSSKAQSVLLAATPASDVSMSGNVLSGLTLAVTNSAAEALSERLSFANNSVSMGPGSSHNAGILLFWAKGVTGTGNTLAGLGHGIQWWGGNSGTPGANLSQVTRTGGMQFTGNHCRDIGGACIWGSMGSDVEIRGNDAAGCGDVCFDTEGGLRTEILGNTATGCGNGCAAVFFFSDQTAITGNHFRADAPGGGLVLIKNASQNPMAHQHLTISGNELRCMTKVCWAVHQEAASGVVFSGNTITDGAWLPLAYGSGLVISGNTMEFTRPIMGVAAAIAAPGMLHSAPLEITSNRVTSQVPQGVACIGASWSDFNSMGFGLIAGNTCGERGMFRVGIGVSSTGKNGGLAGVWYVGGNRLDGGTVEHTAEGSHEVFHELGECGSGACTLDARALRSAGPAPWCVGKPGGPGSVCLGPQAGYVAVPVAR